MFNSRPHAGGGATRPRPKVGSVEELHGDTSVWPRPKVWTRGQKWKKQCQRWRAGEAQMRDNPEGSELDFAEGVRKRCNNSYVSSCKGKKAKSGYVASAVCNKFLSL